MATAASSPSLGEDTIITDMVCEMITALAQTSGQQSTDRESFGTFDHELIALQKKKIKLSPKRVLENKPVWTIRDMYLLVALLNQGPITFTPSADGRSFGSAYGDGTNAKVPTVTTSSIVAQVYQQFHKNRSYFNLTSDFEQQLLFKLVSPTHMKVWKVLHRDPRHAKRVASSSLGKDILKNVRNSLDIPERDMAKVTFASLSHDLGGQCATSPRNATVKKPMSLFLQLLLGLAGWHPPTGYIWD